MRAHTLAIGAFAGVAAVMMTVSGASAQMIRQTWISGTVFNQGGTPVSGGTVNVTCGSTTKTAVIDGSGNYAKEFSQVECKVGDTVTSTASTAEGSGTNSETVQNTPVNGPIVDLDIAVVDITVPEFGLIGGAITGVASIAGYLALKAKGQV